LALSLEDLPEEQRAEVERLLKQASLAALLKTPAFVWCP
jgi:hypothetical protein